MGRRSRAPSDALVKDETTRRLQYGALAGIALFALLLQGAYLYNAVRWIDAPDRGWFAMVQLGPNVVATARPLGIAAGLRDGDTIVRLNGSSYRTFDELWDLLDYELGRVNVYEVERSGETVRVELENQPLGLRRVFMQSGIIWLLGISITGLGFLVFAMKPFHSPSWAFLSMAVLFGVMISYFAPSHHVFEPALLNNVVIFIVPTLPATLLTLAALFPQRKPALLERRYWLVFPYLVSLTLAVISRTYGTWVGFLPPPLLTLIYVYLLGSVVAFLASAVYDYMTTRTVAVRLQSLVILTGMTLAMLIPALELVSNLTFGVSIFPNLIAVYAICLFFFPLSIGYAIARHDLFEISTVVRRTYGYILSSSAVIGAYGLVLSLLNLTTFANFSETTLFRISFLLVVAFTFEPLHRRSQGFVDTIFYRRRYDYRKTIRQITEAMTSILDPATVRSTFLGTLVDEMMLESGVLLLPDTETGEYRASDVLGLPAVGEPSKVDHIRFDDSLIAHLEHDQNPIFRHDVDLNPAFANSRENLQNHFTQLGAEAVIAMTYQSETIGLVSLGQKKSGRMFSMEDLDLLQTMTNQTAIALQNAKLFDDLSASLKQIQILESIKSNLAKFVPQTVQDMIEESPESTGIFDKREKDLSVMFADMVGYTRLSSQLPLDEVNGIIERYFGAFLDEILRHGGDVNETAGDGLMVLFQHDDPAEHARSAVRAALGIQRLTREINIEREGQIPIGMHIGVNSGTASVGATKISGAGGGNRWTYTASGPMTNISARVGALGSEIAITEATQVRLGSGFELEPLGPQTLKNVAEPIGAYRVVGAVSTPASRPIVTVVHTAQPPSARVRPELGEGWFRISGVLTEQNTGRPLPGLLVRAYDKDFVFDDYLGRTSSDRDGCFEIRFTEDLFRDLFERNPDVYLRIYDASGTNQIHSTLKRVRADAGPDERFAIELPAERLLPGWAPPA
jgi:class 3 adenylate cyclase